MMDQLVLLLLPALAALLGTYMWEGVQIISMLLDKKIPVQIHGIVLLVVNFLLMNLGQAIGLSLPETLSGFTPEVMTSVALALGQMGWHHQKNKGKVPDTLPPA